MSLTFLKDAAERAVKTALQAAFAAFVVPVTDLYSLAAWKGALITAVAAGVSVLTSILSKGVADEDTASVVPEIVGVPSESVR